MFNRRMQNEAQKARLADETSMDLPSNQVVREENAKVDSKTWKKTQQHSKYHMQMRTRKKDEPEM